MANRGRPASFLLIASPTVERRKRWGHGFEGTFEVHEAVERADLDRTLADLKPAILLLDLALPRLGGFDGVTAMRLLSPSTKILVFTSLPNEKEGVAALRAGALGYCETDIDPGLLKKAVSVVQKGEIWVRRNLIPHLIEELASLTNRRKRDIPAKLVSRLDRLTPREREIVSLIGACGTNKEIARRLKVTEKTVKAHLTTVFRKLELPGRVRLALYVNEREPAPIESVETHERAKFGSRRSMGLKSN
jgi:two-component system nitrate/nitrite response regulator NarL